MEGLPPETEEEIEDRIQDSPKCSLRGTVWKILLGIKDVDSAKYIELLKKGQSDQNNEQFTQVVSQAKLSRCLNAFAHSCAETKAPLSYVQGMNVICGAFLYVLPELDAFYCFSTLVLQYCHLYLVPKISGVHTALNILDTILEFVDPELYGYLKTRSYDPQLLTHGTSTPPLSELLCLWDFYFAFGIHLNVICTISHLLLMRDTLLAHPSPCSRFRTLPDLDSEKIINLSIHIVRQLPDRLYDALVVHPYSELPDSTNESQDELSM
eukprot:gene440-525_t